MATDHELFGEFASPPEEVVPGWRGRSATLLVTIDLVRASVVVLATVLWAEWVDDQPNAELISASMDGLDLVVLSTALKQASQDGITILVTAHGLAVWLRLTERVCR